MNKLTTIVEARAADDTLYHFTGLKAASEILRSDEFELTSSLGNKIEAGMQRGRRTYYLSTTRHKLGGFTTSADDGVVFNLDSNKLSHNYKISAVDFFKGHRRRSQHPEFDESEDRVFSYEPNIPNASSYIKSIHALLPAYLTKTDKYSELKRYVRNILLISKQKQIPLNWYGNESDFQLQRNPIDLDISQFKTFDIPTWEKNRIRKNQSSPELDSVVELIKKPVGRDLSPASSKLLYVISGRGGRSGDTLGNLYYAISRNSDRNEISTISRYMRVNKIGTVDQMLYSLNQKWDSPKRRPLDGVVDLIYKNPPEQISNTAKSILVELAKEDGGRSIKYEMNELFVDLLFGLQSPPAVNIINNYMKSIGDNGFPMLLDHLSEKWSSI